MVNSFVPCTYVSDGEEKATKFLCDFHVLLDPFRLIIVKHPHKKIMLSKHVLNLVTKT